MTGRRNEAINAISKYLPASEVHEVKEFRADVPGHGELVIELYDSGAQGESTGYWGRAYDPTIPADERGPNSNGETTGNPSATIDEAIGDLHSWIFRTEE